MNSSKIFPRVFQRNTSNIIIVWDTNHLEEKQKSNVVCEIEENGKRKLLTYSMFSCPNKEKFGDNLTGIVINQKDNNLIPREPYLIRISSGSSKEVSASILVQPYRLTSVSAMVKLSAWDQENKRFEKLHGVWKDNKFYLGIVNVDKPEGDK